MNRRRMTATAVAGVAALALAAACSSGGSNDKGDNGTPKALDTTTPTTLTVWSAFSGRELGILGDALKGFHDKYPNITIKNVGEQDDDKIVAAIGAGNPPDVVISFSTDKVGQYCSSGGWQDLTQRLKDSKVDLDQFPQAVRDYTSFDGKRCALPLLADVYGLYYNTDLLKAAGYDAPPKTMSELSDMAKKLTQYNSDGSIKVAGYVPWWGFYENAPAHYAPSFGAKWFDGDKSALGSDSAWQDMIKWQKDLVDSIGASKLAKFTASAGQEFSADNAFETGKIAMMVDGEYRTAFIQSDHPELKYATAPMPTADNQTDLYGGGYVTGTIIGLPKGSPHPDAAWALIKYLTTDNAPLVTLANGLHNVPTTIDSLDAATDLKNDPHFKTFLDIFNSGKLATTPAASIGSDYQTKFGDYLVNYQQKGSSNLAGDLTSLDKQIDDEIALKGGA